ncbi:MAG: poly(3-hydroxybutyrate) depolymerase, partial [Candidatus Accumulibacter sp.]|nr:poly(3-hydroxybutyrate) depolymerase [Accumulibacter sp.]
MAVQFQVAHAKLVRGAGIIAGGPYNCAGGSALRALTRCTSLPAIGKPPDSSVSRADVETLARAGRIDSPENLRDDRVWLLSGGKDRIVKTAVMEQLAAFYAQWLPVSAIDFVRLPAASHAMISISAPQTTACDSNKSPYINKCGNFDAAGRMLEHMLGSLHPPNTSLGGQMLAFDQQPFIDGKAIDASLDDNGYVYVPQDCL